MSKMYLNFYFYIFFTLCVYVSPKGLAPGTVKISQNNSTTIPDFMGDLYYHLGGFTGIDSSLINVFDKSKFTSVRGIRPANYSFDDYSDLGLKFSLDRQTVDLFEVTEMGFLFQIRPNNLKNNFPNCTFAVYIEKCNIIVHNYGFKTEKLEFQLLSRKSIVLENDVIHLNPHSGRFYVYIELTNPIRNYFFTNRIMKILLKLEYTDEYDVVREAGAFETRELVQMTARDDECKEALLLVFTKAGNYLLQNRRSTFVNKVNKVKRSLFPVHQSDLLNFCSIYPLIINTNQFYPPYIIIGPKRLNINFCAGSCISLRTSGKVNATQNAIARDLLLHNELTRSGANPILIPAPYCSPEKFTQIYVFFKYNVDYLIESVVDLVVTSCICS